MYNSVISRLYICIVLRNVTVSARGSASNAADGKRARRLAAASVGVSVAGFVVGAAIWGLTLWTVLTRGPDSPDCRARFEYECSQCTSCSSSSARKSHCYSGKVCYMSIYPTSTPSVRCPDAMFACGDSCYWNRYIYSQSECSRNFRESCFSGHLCYYNRRRPVSTLTRPATASNRFGTLFSCQNSIFRYSAAYSQSDCISMFSPTYCYSLSDGVCYFDVHPGLPAATTSRYCLLTCVGHCYSRRESYSLSDCKRRFAGSFCYSKSDGICYFN